MPSLKCTHGNCENMCRGGVCHKHNPIYMERNKQNAKAKRIQRGQTKPVGRPKKEAK